MLQFAATSVYAIALTSSQDLCKFPEIATSIDNLLYLGQALSQMWESRLKSLYPQRRFQVKCDRDEHTVVVTFFQEK